MLYLVKRKGRLNEEEAMQYALRSLGRRMQTRHELLEKLRRRTTDEIAAAVVARLEEWNYLDDAAYAEAFVRGHQQRWGSQRIAAELRRRGVSEEIIRSQLQASENSEEERALQLLVKSEWRHKGEKPRMVRFLQGRGFGLGAAIAAAEEYLKLRESEESG